MKPKIIFTDNHTFYSLLESGDSYYVLTKNEWNDNGYYTKFEVKFIKNGQSYTQKNRKILFDNQKKSEESYNLLRKKINNDGYVEIEDIKGYRDYISLGNDYEEIKAVFPDYYEDILESLNDVTCYLRDGTLDPTVKPLIQHPAFKESLLREQSFKKSFNDLVIENSNKGKTGSDITSVKPAFKFEFDLGERNYKYEFPFFDENNLPHRINLLIGKNGTGISQTLKYIAKYLMFQQQEECVTVEKHPDFILNLIVFAYNPYEDFYIPKEKDGKTEGLLINYKYVGLKKRKDDDIIFNPEFPKIESYQSFITLLQKDIKNFDPKRDRLYDKPFILEIIEHLEKSDESFSGFALKFKEEANTQKYISELTINSKPEGNFIFIKPDIQEINKYSMFNDDSNLDDFENEVFFFDKQEDIRSLSSGQKIFSYLVINLLSMIEKNSLVLIDEPETALHPNLEISFMKILKSILETHKSYAIIATHSAIITREVPDKFVHVVSVKDMTKVSIDKPVMKTFGSNIGDITNYIFDDVFQEEKPYQEWLVEQKEKYDNYEDFHEKIGKTLSYEIRTEARKLWLSND